MCINGATSSYSSNLELAAFGPPLSPLTTNTSITCSCYINITYFSNEVTVRFSRNENSVTGCWKNQYDEATLDTKPRTIDPPLTLQNDDLSSYSDAYEDISSISLSITINSICGSNYTIQLEASEYSSKQTYEK